jgi:hypothetical protein
MMSIQNIVKGRIRSLKTKKKIKKIKRTKKTEEKGPEVENEVLAQKRTKLMKLIKIKCHSEQAKKEEQWLLPGMNRNENIIIIK